MSRLDLETRALAVFEGLSDSRKRVAVGVLRVLDDPSLRAAAASVEGLL